MVFKCSECGGEVRPLSRTDEFGKKYSEFRCTKCGREKRIEERTVDMSGLEVIVE